LINPIVIYFFSSAQSFDSRYDYVAYVLSLMLIQHWGFHNQLTWNIPAWSISTEWAAYMLFPLVVWLTDRFGKSTVGLFLLIVGWLGILAGIGVSFGYTLDNISNFGILRCLFQFAAGVALYRLWRSNHQWNELHGIVAFTASIMLLVASSSLTIPALLTVPAAFILLLFALITESRLFCVLKVSPLVFLGEISYSTYLSHYLVKDWTKFLMAKPGASPFLIIFVYLGAVGLVSAILYRFVELPGRRLSRRLAVSGDLWIILRKHAMAKLKT
jgi:peptidoglycan/LPS O-acetylase OafA/YrhL